jgi:hypothetical protein
MPSEQRRYFRNVFCQARQAAFQDAEGFQEILFALERLGAFRSQSIGALGQYKDHIEEVAQMSPLALEIPVQWRGYHPPFSSLYELVRGARNDALHQGACARHLTNHAVQVSLIIEDALMSDAKLISDFMIHDVVEAKTWQPVSFVRQQMLANSFSFMPLQQDGDWQLLSDAALLRYLSTERKKRMAHSIQEAIKGGLTLDPANCCSPDEKVEEVIDRFCGTPILVVDKDPDQRLLGIVTCFDLL